MNTECLPANAVLTDDLPSDDGAFVAAELVGPQHPDRAFAEQYVATVYRRRFEADVVEFMPFLLCFYRSSRALAAVVGLRCAEHASLFCEQYLHAPVEQVLAEQMQEPTSRGHVVEMGNFAAADAGAGRRLILALIPLLHAAGTRFVLFVATRQLRNAFKRLGLSPISLGSARAERLGAAAGRWGRYYQEQPEVMFGDLRRAPVGTLHNRLIRLDADNSNAGQHFQMDLCAEWQ